MPTIKKVPVLWSGGTGLPGYSVFYGFFTGDPTGGLNTFFTALKGYVPQTISWQIPNAGDTIDDATGTINGAWTGTGGGTITATNINAYAAGTGGYVRWNTPNIVAGRRLKGRTFLCPLATGAYQSDGTIEPTSLAAIQAAATTLAAAGTLVVWHRPSSPGASDGESHLITSAQAPDKVTSLRSRRN
jgi:hypothetical protein